MVDLELLSRHSPPGEVELLVGCHVSQGLAETVVALRAVELLLEVESVVQVGNCSGDQTNEESAMS